MKVQNSERFGTEMKYQSKILLDMLDPVNILTFFDAA
jgi:hypothetical protein